MCACVERVQSAQWDRAPPQRRGGEMRVHLTRFRAVATSGSWGMSRGTVVLHTTIL